MMARTAEWRDDISGTITTGGSATAYTVTSNQVFDSLAHMTGAMVTFIPHATNTGTCTLAVDGLTAKPLRLSPSIELPAGYLVLGAPYVATYVNADNAFYLQGIVNSGISWVAAGGSADAITATYAPALTALYDGLVCSFRASAANATTTPTFSPNSLTAHTITKKGGSAVAVGDIAAALSEVIVRYNLANTRWELLNPATVPVAALKAPTNQQLTSGSSATYTAPTSPAALYIRVRMCGGGGGGADVGIHTGGNGGTTTFGGITAVGGTGGPASQLGGAGGTGGTGSGVVGLIRLRGGHGSGMVTGAGAGVDFAGNGGNTPFFGGGGLASLNGTSGAGAANTGGGGASGAAGLGSATNGSGGSGEYAEFIVTSVPTTITYTVGAGGTAGSGTGNAGGVGGTGVIVVDEFYQ